MSPRLTKEEREEGDLLHINRIDKFNSNTKSHTIGWQVRFHRSTGYLSKLFSDGVHGGSEGALGAARAYRNDVLQSKGESLGSYIEKRTFVLPELPKNNKSGILGVNRSIATERNGTTHYLWQATFKRLDGKIQNRSFRVNKYGEAGALIESIKFRKEGVESYVAKASNEEVSQFLSDQVKQYDELIDFLKTISEEEAETLLAYLSEADASPTSKKRLLESRISQSIFRKAVLENWGGVCAITGASSLLIASHIKPWAVSTDLERIDPFNGLALSPTYDKAFDLGFITFGPAGRICLSKEIVGQAHLLGISLDANLPNYAFRYERYMQYHRKEIFKGNYHAEIAA